MKICTKKLKHYAILIYSIHKRIAYINQENVETRKLNNCIKSLIIKNKYVKIQNYLSSTQEKFVIFISISLPFNYFVYSFDGEETLKFKNRSYLFLDAGV